MIFTRKKSTLSAFTLIELMIVITIIGIISLATYLPYSHHQKKIVLKQSVKEIAQSLSEARNLAINGLNSGSGNVNVALYFQETATEIVYYTLPHDQEFDILSLSSDDIYKTKALSEGVQIDTIDTRSEPLLISYSAIFWTGALQSSSSSQLPEELLFNVSYKGSNSVALQEEIRYFTKSYISDY